MLFQFSKLPKITWPSPFNMDTKGPELSILYHYRSIDYTSSDFQEPRGLPIIYSCRSAHIMEVSVKSNLLYCMQKINLP